MEWELITYADGSLNLYYEDRLHGRDIRFRLNPDGTADRIEDETTTRVELVTALREAYATWKKVMNTY